MTQWQALFRKQFARCLPPFHSASQKSDARLQAPSKGGASNKNDCTVLRLNWPTSLSSARAEALWDHDVCVSVHACVREILNFWTGETWCERCVTGDPRKFALHNFLQSVLKHKHLRCEWHICQFSKVMVQKIARKHPQSTWLKINLHN
jgi:hypothetical protein